MPERRSIVFYLKETPQRCWLLDHRGKRYWTENLLATWPVEGVGRKRPTRPTFLVPGKPRGTYEGLHSNPGNVCADVSLEFIKGSGKLKFIVQKSQKSLSTAVKTGI